MADIKYIDLGGLGEAVKKIKEKADAAYAAVDHGHEVADIIDLQVALDDKVDKVDDHSLVADADIDKIHEHDNHEELDKVVDGKVAEWDAKVGVNDLDKLVFSNQGLSQAQNAKAAIDALIEVNVNIANGIQALEQAVGDAGNDADIAASGLYKLIADGDADVLEAAKQHADDAIAALVDSAPDTMNTLQELAKAITDHQDVYDAYVETVEEDIADAKAAAEAEAARLDGVLKGELQGEIDADVEVEKLRAEGVEAGFEQRIKALEDAKDTHAALTADEIAGAINSAWV